MVRSTLAATGQATERDIKAVSLIFSPSLGLHLRAGCPRRSPRSTCRIGRGCIASRGGREAVGKREEETNMGCGGPRLGRLHARIQYLDAGCQNPVTAAGCPATGTGTGSLFLPNRNAWKFYQVDAGRGTWLAPAVESWIDWLHIHQTRPNVPAAWVPGRGSLISADCRLQSTTKSLVAMLLSFSLLLFPRP